MICGVRTCLVAKYGIEFMNEFSFSRELGVLGARSACCAAHTDKYVDGRRHGVSFGVERGSHSEFAQNEIRTRFHLCKDHIPNLSLLILDLHWTHGGFCESVQETPHILR